MHSVFARLMPLRRFFERWGILIAIPVVGWLALATNPEAILADEKWVNEQLSQKGDIRNLYFAAANAGWSDAPKWFAGPWNSPGIGYYRPLTSVLFLIEQHAFGRDFTRWNTVSWLAN